MILTNRQHLLTLFIKLDPLAEYLGTPSELSASASEQGHSWASSTEGWIISRSGGHTETFNDTDYWTSVTHFLGE